MQAHGNAFTAVSSRLHQPKGSGGWLQRPGSEAACFPLYSGKSLSYNFPPLKLPMSQEQPSCKKNSTDHSGGHQMSTMAWSLRSFSEES